MTLKPRLLLLAGPNGAGKSTFYETFLSSLQLPFLNADLVSAATVLDSFEAARVLDSARERFIAARLSFVTETVFSDPAGHKLDMLRRAVSAGYDVDLVYIGIANPQALQGRVDQRVAGGGHDVPRDKIVSRYERSLRNLRLAIDFVPTVELYDNSSSAAPYQHVATFQRGVLAHRMHGRIRRWAREVVRDRAQRQ